MQGNNNSVNSQREEHKAQLDLIRRDINQIKIEGRWISAIQIAAIVLTFGFGIVTLTDLKKKLK